jgi:hypothetical protein
MSRVHHLLVVGREDGDRPIEIEPSVFELHGFLAPFDRRACPAKQNWFAALPISKKIATNRCR